METGVATSAQEAYFKASSEQDQQSDFLSWKVAVGLPLTDEERTQLLGFEQQYTDEMTQKYGAAQAATSLADLLQNGTLRNYDYPFAGTDEQKADWVKANSQTFTELVATQFRSKSEDETLYDSIGQRAQIAKGQEDDVQIGQLALLPEEDTITGVLAIGATIFGDVAKGESALGAEISKPISSSSGGGEFFDILSDSEKQHILYGDGPGSGGHLWPAQEGKTPFPENWSAEKIVHELGDIVTSPDTQWYAQTGTGGVYNKAGNPAKWVSYEERDGVRIRLVYMPATGKVITAFPDLEPIPTAYKAVR
ncbi:hypothetical protein PMM47T1_20748 [Pseudomonas sp. M47T1]|nr:hypothetical protein PMM47T1_20748 [Pseudomonas sp. M47T1]